MAQASQAFAGTIKMFNTEKGWGHIECDQTFQLYGKDIFLLRSELNGNVPCKGDEVYFDVVEGQKGAQATNVLTVSKAAQGAYVGTIKSWNPVKGWGHITCDTTHAMYEKDIFVMRSAIAGGECRTGDEVYFDVIDGQKGAEATNVQIAITAQISGDGSYIGTVKSWNPDKGWGHITCDTTHAMYAKDIFVMRSAITGGECCMGDQVSFSVEEGQKGPEAAKVKVLTMRARSTQHSKGFTGSIKSFDEAKGWGHISCEQTRTLYGKDMFFMRSALNGQTVAGGENVRFEVGMGQKGPEAHDVVIGHLPKGGGKGKGKGTGQVVRPPSMMPQQPAWNQYQAPATFTTPQQQMMQATAAPYQSGLYSGTVKNWNPEKGWGFISCQDTMNIYGKDIFLHQKELFDQKPLAGSMVQFSVQLGPDGRPIATSVNLNSGYAPSLPTGYARAAPY